MKSVYILLCILFFSFSSGVSGQNNPSAKEIDFDSMSKFEQVQTLSKRCWENREKQTDEAIKFGLKGIEIAKQEGFQKELGVLYNYVGVVYQHYKYDTQTAIKYYNKGLPISLQENDSIEIAYVYNNLGDAFYRIGNVPLAFEYANKSMQIFERLGNKKGIAYSYINMGSVNRINQRYNIALDYFKKAIELRQTFKDSIGIASAHLELAQTIFLMGETDKAMKYFRESLSKHQKLDNKLYIAYSLQGIGDVYLTQNKLDSAYHYFKEALKFSTDRHNLSAQIDSQLGIAKTLALQGNKAKGETMLNRALSIAYESKITKNILKVYKTRGEFYHRLEQYQKASLNYQNYIATYDSLFSALQFQTLSEIKDRFQITEQLNTVNENLETKKNTLLFVIVIVVLLILFLITLIFRNQKIANLSIELQQSNQTKDKIFSIISHDLISPFNVLIGASELMMDDLENNDIKSAKSNGSLIQQTSEDAFQLISNLLNWARSQRKKIKIYLEEFQIEELIFDVKSMLQNQAVLKNIEFKVEAEENIVIKADRNLIQIVLVNLINNAIKFTDKGGDILISVKKEGLQTKISVKDNGVGIAKARLETLFNNQAITSMQGTQNEKGTGLGLLLCKEFVEMHGGKIFAISKEGEGSEFTFTLPVA